MARGRMAGRTVMGAACLLLLSGCSKKSEEEKVEAPAPVQVAKVQQDTIRRLVSGDGVLFPHDQASIMPKVSAPVQKFYVNRGDHVRRGQLLAVLENRDLVASAGEAKGTLEQAESNLRSTQGATVPEAVVKAQADVEAARQARDAAKKVLDSREQLFREGALARRQVEESQVAYAQADSQYRSAQEHLKALQSVSKEEQIKSAAAQVQSARSHYQSVEAQVNYSRITSPIGGIVGDRPLYEGDMAAAGTPLATVIDISRVVARVNVPQAQAQFVKVGQPATVSVNAASEPRTGRVIVVSPATDPNTTTVQVWVELENPGERLKPGTSVHAEIIAEIFKAAIIVPAAAILPGEAGGTAVLTVGADSTAHKKQVDLGVREGNKVQILRGVAPGEEVVVVGGLGVEDNAKVKVTRSTSKEAAGEDENAAPEEGNGAGKNAAPAKPK